LERPRFEEACDSLFKRVESPVTQALKQAQISVEDLTGVEILGGGVRVPKVHDILKEVSGKDELSVHLNGDEAMCFGSAFIVSNFTSSFKVRHFYLTQHPKYDV
jgi:hypoxia up-regulated 1